jgi:hypothetical protein
MASVLAIIRSASALESSPASSNGLAMTFAFINVQNDADSTDGRVEASAIAQLGSPSTLGRSAHPTAGQRGELSSERRFKA